MTEFELVSAAAKMSNRLSSIARGMFDELPSETVNVSRFSDSSLIMGSGKWKRMIGMLWR